MAPEVQQFLEGISTYQAIIWSLFAIGLGVGVYKAWPVLRRFVKTVDALGDLPDFMERIRHQVENDHDTNLRDEVTQLLDQLDVLVGQVAGLADWQKKHEEKSDALVGRVDRMERGSRANDS